MKVKKATTLQFWQTHALEGKAFALALLLAALFVTGCTETAPSERAGAVSSPSAPPSSEEPPKGSNASSEPAGEPTFKLVDVESARATIHRVIEVGVTAIFATGKLPVLNLDLKEADFVEVLRCARSYELRSQTNGVIDINNITSLSSSDLKWAWLTAVSNTNSCKIIGNKISGPQYVDLAAKSGSYYYIVNPCISEERSFNKKAGCSYKLSMSEAYDYVSDFSDLALEKAVDVSAAEVALNADINHAKMLAKKIVLHLTACENMVAHDQHLLSFKNGLLALGSLVVGAAIGTALGGPGMGVMMGMFSQQALSQVLNTYVFKMPTGILNECVNPEVVATTAEERESGSFKTKNSGKYEEEFQVQGLLKKLVALTEEETGLIAKNIKRLEIALNELALLEQRIVSWDDIIAKAASQGANINEIIKNASAQPADGTL